MAEPPLEDDARPPSPQEEPAAKKPDDAPSAGDLAAIGIGCLVVIIFFIAIVMVGATRE